MFAIHEKMKFLHMAVKSINFAMIANRKTNHHLHPSESMSSLSQYFKLHIVLLGCTIIFLVVTKIEATGCRLLKDYFFHKYHQYSLESSSLGGYHQSFWSVLQFKVLKNVTLKSASAA